MTTDERQALCDVIKRWEGDGRFGYDSLADAILAAGFTRSRAATEPSEGEVEAAAKSLWRSWNPTGPTWQATNEATRIEGREVARAALRAARGVGK